MIYAVIQNPTSRIAAKLDMYSFSILQDDFEMVDKTLTSYIYVFMATSELPTLSICRAVRLKKMKIKHQCI